MFIFGLLVGLIIGFGLPQLLKLFTKKAETELGIEPPVKPSVSQSNIPPVA